MTEATPFLTDDGSHTLYHPGLGEHYHSTYGAIQESQHVFIESGLDYLEKKEGTIRILEVGFGTGLNALLTLKWAKEKGIEVDYITVEPYPIAMEMAGKLNFSHILGLDNSLFLKLHTDSAERLMITTAFTLLKLFSPLQECSLNQNHFDVIFFDAFSPDVQPELWSEGIFTKLGNSLKAGGVLTTYSSKGIVKRALRSSGFEVKRLAGPPGKREILRAVK